MKKTILYVLTLVAIQGFYSMGFAQTSGAHKIGDSFGGGIIIQLTKGDDGKEHGLIAGNKNLENAGWSANTSTKIGASSTSDGSANTALILKEGGKNSDAAGLCKEYKNEGFADWYLPSIDELKLLCANLKLAPDDSGFFWSSTEKMNGSAWGLDCSSGTPTSSNKLRKALVRPVRVF
jgi:hypothetical protein